MTRLVVVLSVLIVALAGCSPGQSDACSVVDNDDGTYTITCPDGSEVTIEAGERESGFAVLVKVEGEPPGMNCVYGGMAIHSGRDINGDGVLGPDEIESTVYMCHGVGSCDVLDDSVVIRNVLEWRQLEQSGCRVLTGDLIIEGISGIEDYSFPTVAPLREIGGSLIVRDNPSLESLVGLGALTWVGGDVYVTRNNGLRRIEGLVSLSFVGGDMRIQQNPRLRSLYGLDALSYVSGELALINNYSLTSLRPLKALRSVRDLVLQDCGSLTNLEGLELLTSLDGTLDIFRNSSLVNLKGLEGLRYVGDDVLVADHGRLISLAGLDSLTEIGGSLVVGGHPWFGRNFSLEELGLESLAHVAGDLTIRYNPVLPECRAWDLHDQIEAARGVGGSVDIRENDTTGTCE